MATPQDGLAALRSAAETGELDELCARHQIRVLTVFGSTARGEPSPNDLDIGVLFEPHTRPDLVDLVNDLISLTGTDAVDIAHLNRGGPVIRERALVGSIPLFESEPFALSRAEVAAVMERMDTDWMRRMDLELMAR